MTVSCARRVAARGNEEMEKERGILIHPTTSSGTKKKVGEGKGELNWQKIRSDQFFFRSGTNPMEKQNSLVSVEVRATRGGKRKINLTCNAIDN